MKKQIFFAIIAATLSFTFANAQGGGRFQRRTVEERVKATHNFLDSAFNREVSTANFILLDSVFAFYYRAQDKLRDDMMANSGGGRPDQAAMDEMRAKMQELVKERDEKLQKIFTEAQMKKWKDEIEPALNPRRGNRPSGGNK